MDALLSRFDLYSVCTTLCSITHTQWHCNSCYMYIALYTMDNIVFDVKSSIFLKQTLSNDAQGDRLFIASPSLSICKLTSGLQKT